MLEGGFCCFGGERGIRTPGTLYEFGSLANCWFQPLTHLTKMSPCLRQGVQRYKFFLICKYCVSCLVLPLFTVIQIFIATLLLQSSHVIAVAKLSCHCCCKAVMSLLLQSYYNVALVFACRLFFRFSDAVAHICVCLYVAEFVVVHYA